LPTRWKRTLRPGEMILSKFIRNSRNELGPYNSIWINAAGVEIPRKWTRRDWVLVGLCGAISHSANELRVEHGCCW
ncbi:MAG: hypothetical protein N2C12_07130, partial [Planctomycetales bacterium]